MSLPHIDFRQWRRCKLCHLDPQPRLSPQKSLHRMLSFPKSVPRSKHLQHKAWFLQDFLFKKLEIERYGWRSLGEVRRSLKLSKYALYDRTGGMNGSVTKELLSKGLAETTRFPGERVRSGEIMKIRICYGKMPLKGYPNQGKMPLEE